MEEVKMRRTDIPRIKILKRPVLDRIKDFDEVYSFPQQELIQKEASRCLMCRNAPCVKACPLNNKIPEWLYLVAGGDFYKAQEISLQTSPFFPELCGRLCPQEKLCEGACVLKNRWKSVAIGLVEAYIHYYARKTNTVKIPQPGTTKNKKVAIIGAGPAGLTCAQILKENGIDSKIFDTYDKPGGVITYGLPGFKMQKEVLEFHIKKLEKLGCEFVCNTTIGKDLDLEQLQKEYDAIFIGIGASKGKYMNIPGEDLGGVLLATPFLVKTTLGDSSPEEFKKIEIPKGKTAIVVGGGDTAMDCVRSCIRLGFEKVICVYRRSEVEFPGREEEKQNAIEEGAEFQYLTLPVRFIGDKGYLKKAECIRMRLGEPDESGRRRPLPIENSNFFIDCDLAVIAIGYEVDANLTKSQNQIKLSKWKTIEVKEDYQTNISGVFAGGDCVNGADLFVTAIKDGRDAAYKIIEYLR